MRSLSQRASMTDQPDKNLVAEKEISYFSAIVSAYIESSMEKDRSLLTLSAGGIGLLITILTTIGAPSLFIIVLYSVASLSFGSVIVLILYVFGRNRSLLIKLAKNQNVSTDEESLGKLDKSIYTLFALGVSVSFIIGILTSLNQLTKEKTMSEKEEVKIYSLQGLSQMNPNPDTLEKNLQSLSELKPTSNEASTQNPNSTPSNTQENNGGSSTSTENPPKPK